MNLPAISGMAAGAALTTAAILHMDATEPDGWKHGPARLSDPMFLPIFGGAALAGVGLLLVAASKNPQVANAGIAAGTFGTSLVAGGILGGTAVFPFVD